MSELTPFERSIGASVRPTSSEACLDPEVLVEMASRRRKTKGFDRHFAHIALCPSCRETLRAIRSAEAAKPKGFCLADFVRQILAGLAVPRTAFVVAGVAVLLAVLVLRSGDSTVPTSRVDAPVASRGKNPPRTIPTPSPETPDKPVVAAKPKPHRIKPRPKPRIRHQAPVELPPADEYGIYPNEHPEEPGIFVEAPQPETPADETADSISGVVEGGTVVEGFVESSMVLSGELRPRSMTLEGEVIPASNPARKGTKRTETQ